MIHQQQHISNACKDRATNRKRELNY